MAKLPTQYDIDTPSYNPSRAVGVPTNLDAPGRAMAALGRSIVGLGQDIGSSIAASSGGRVSGNEAYQANMDVSNFIFGEKMAMMDAQRNMQPGGEVDFAQNWSNGFYDRASEFVGNQPDNVKPIVDAKLRSFEQQQILIARKFQYEEAFRKTQLDAGLKMNQEWSVDAKTLPTGELDKITASIDGWLLDAIQADRLSPIEAEQLRWSLLNQVGVAHLRANMGVDENIVYRRLGVPAEKRRKEITSHIAGSGSPYQVAMQYIGQGEIPDNQSLKEFLKSGGFNIDPAKTPWCAGFVNSGLAAGGIEGTNSLAASSFLKWGQPTDDPRQGDIVVIASARGRGASHVGFFKGYDKEGRILVLGGNQGDRVSVASYAPERVMAFRKAPEGVTEARVKQADEDIRVAQAEDPYAYGGLPAPIAALTDGQVETWRKGNEAANEDKQVESIAFEVVNDIGLTRADAYKQVNEMDLEPKIREKVKSLMDKEFARQDALAVEQERETFDEAYGTIKDLADGGNYAEAQKQVDIIEAEGTLDRQTIAKLRSVADGTDRNDIGVYEDIMFLATSPNEADRQEFMQKDLRQYRHQLDQSHLEHLYNIQQQMRAGQGQVDIDPAVKTAEGYIKGTIMPWLGIETGVKAGPEDVYIRRGLLKLAIPEIQKAERNNGDKELMIPEINKIVDDVVNTYYKPIKRNALMQKNSEGFWSRTFSGEPQMWTMEDVLKEYNEAEAERDQSTYGDVPPGALLDYAIADAERQGAPINAKTLWIALRNFRRNHMQ